MVTCMVKATFICQSTPRRLHHLTSLGDLTQTDMITWLEIWSPEDTMKRGGWKGASPKLSNPAGNMETIYAQLFVRIWHGIARSYAHHLR